jgi:type IV pilus assembly protein PilE
MLIRCRGFTLIELMIVVAIVGILSVLAYPSFQDYLRKSRRGEALSSLMSIHLNQEKHRANNPQYGTLAQVWGGVTTTENGYYNLTVGGLGASTVTMTATAVGDQANDRAGATGCGTLTVTVNGPAVTKNPAACWAQ